MRSDLSKRQEEILIYIDNFIRHKGYPPTIREICQGVNIRSTSTVHSNVNKLEEKGYIKRDAFKNRTIEVVPFDSEEDFIKIETFDVPILGRVQAGEPILAIENIEEYYPLPIEYSTYGSLFILRVQGDSMIEAGILDGDYVIVRQQSTAETGEIIVAMIDESATVKRYYKGSEFVELRPENSSMSSIFVKELDILGKVISLYRNNIY